MGLPGPCLPGGELRALATRSAPCGSSRERGTWRRPGSGYDWALSAEAQALAVQVKSFQVPSNRNAKTPQSPKFTTIKLIDYDFAKYGSSAERTRLLQRWDQAVKALTK